jgi:hypothetical protein
MERKNVFARCKFLLPSLDFFLSRKTICLHDPIYHCRELASRLVHILYIAIVASNAGRVIVSISFGFSGDGNLGDLLGRLVADHNFSSSLDIQDQRMTSKSLVKTGMLPISSAASVEAVKAYIETGRIVLLQKLNLDRIQSFEE